MYNVPDFSKDELEKALEEADATGKGELLQIYFEAESGRVTEASQRPKEEWSVIGYVYVQVDTCLLSVLFSFVTCGFWKMRKLMKLDHLQNG